MRMVQHLRWVAGVGIVVGVVVGCFERTPPKTAADASGTGDGLSSCEFGGGTKALQECQRRTGCACKLVNTGKSCGENGPYETLAFKEPTCSADAGSNVRRDAGRVYEEPDAGAAIEERLCDDSILANGVGRLKVVLDAFGRGGARVDAALARMEKAPNDSRLKQLLAEDFGVGRTCSGEKTLTFESYREALKTALEKLATGFGMVRPKKKSVPDKQLVLFAYCVREPKPEVSPGDRLAAYRDIESNTFEIYDAFFAASADVQTATAVHEMAHVWVPGAYHGDDLALLPTAANKLAGIYPPCPSKALLNPYSIEEFVMKYSR